MARAAAREEPSRGAAHPVSHAHFLWIVGNASQLLRVTADAGLLAREFPAPHRRADLERALRAAGLRTAHRKLNRGQALRTPCIAFLRDHTDSSQQADRSARGTETGTTSAAFAAAPGTETGTTAAAATSVPDTESGTTSAAATAAPGTAPARASIPVLVVKSDGERLLYFRPDSTIAQTARLGEPGAAFDPEVITVEPAERAAAAEGAAIAPEVAPPRFGLAWFSSELVRHRRVLRDVLLASAALQVAGLATPLFTQVIIDKVVVHHGLSTLAVVAGGLAIVIVFGALMSWLRQYLLIHTGNRIDAVLCTRVFARLLRLPLAYFDRRPTGTLVARLQAVESIREFLSGALLALVLELPFMFVFLAVMFFYSWKLTLIALALVGLIGALSLIAAPRLRERLNRQFLLAARNQAFVTEHVAAMETVKSLQMEPRLEARFAEYLSAYLGAAFRTRQLGNTCTVAASTLEQAQTLCILAVGALLVIEQPGFTIGMLVAFQMFAARMSQPLLRLVGLYQQFQEASIAVRRLADIMDAPAEPHALVTQREPARGPAAIEIRGLAFGYGPQRPALFRDFDLSVAPGSLLAILGPSGCGKSTLARLLQGFHLPSAGGIAIDGIDIRHPSANALRAQLGVVPQETVLFSGSILENVLAGQPDAGFEDVIRACRAAGIHDFVQGLPQGYQTEIGERGVGLSGGQKQRIAIARALLRRPRVLLFDEATASLDADTAARFAHTINQLKGQATILFIAHRLPPGLEADDVVRLGAEPGEGVKR